MKPVLLVNAGPNGAGKTSRLTLAETDPVLANFISQGGAMMLAGLPIISHGIAPATVLDSEASPRSRTMAGAVLVVGIVTGRVGSEIARVAQVAENAEGFGGGAVLFHGTDSTSGSPS